MNRDAGRFLVDPQSWMAGRKNIEKMVPFERPGRRDAVARRIRPTDSRSVLGNEKISCRAKQAFKIDERPPANDSERASQIIMGGGEVGGQITRDVNALRCGSDVHEGPIKIEEQRHVQLRGRDRYARFCLLQHTIRPLRVTHGEALGSIREKDLPRHRHCGAGLSGSAIEGRSAGDCFALRTH